MVRKEEFFFSVRIHENEKSQLRGASFWSERTQSDIVNVKSNFKYNRLAQDCVE